MREQMNAMAMNGAQKDEPLKHSVLSGNCNKISLLRVYCLGSFQLVRPGEAGPADIRGKHKLWMLLKYLIAHSGQTVPTRTILDALWPQRENPNDTAPLRTAVSRLKTVLYADNREMTQQNYLIYSKDSCAFNPDTLFWLDAAEFENICRKVMRVGENSRKRGLELFIQALELYRGDFLSGDRLAEWTAPLRARYREMLLDTAREVLQWDVVMQESPKAARILKKALEIDPYDQQFQVLLMKTLINLKDYKAAVKHYTFCTHLFYQKRGIEPAPELRQLYKEVQDKMGTVAERSSIREVGARALETGGEIGGPFVCEPGLFWNLLLLERRRLARNGGEACLVILEIRAPKTGAPQSDREFRNKSIRHLENAAHEKLRKSDVMCRLNDRQLGILLPMTGSKGGEAAAGYLHECFQNFLQEPGVSLAVKIKRITPQGDGNN